MRHLCYVQTGSIIHRLFYFQERRTPKDCLKSRDPSVPDECFALLNTFFECKRGLVSGKQLINIHSNHIPNWQSIYEILAHESIKKYSYVPCSFHLNSIRT